MLWVSPYACVKMKYCCFAIITFNTSTYNNYLPTLTGILIFCLIIPFYNYNIAILFTTTVIFLYCCVFSTHKIKKYNVVVVCTQRV